MYKISYQTVRLSRGKHPSPEHGACVMELASMLAGERFSDHPEAVSPAIGCFLRSYNDMLDDDRRQDLYAFAAECVGTAAGADVERLRAQRLFEWADEMARARWPRRFVRRLKRRSLENHDATAAARYAIQSMGRLSDELHAEVLVLIGGLIRMSLADLFGTPSSEPRDGAIRRTLAEPLDRIASI